MRRLRKRTPEQIVAAKIKENDLDFQYQVLIDYIQRTQRDGIQCSIRVMIRAQQKAVKILESKRNN